MRATATALTATTEDELEAAEHLMIRFAAEGFVPIYSDHGVFFVDPEHLAKFLNRNYRDTFTCYGEGKLDVAADCGHVVCSEAHHPHEGCEASESVEVLLYPQTLIDPAEYGWRCSGCTWEPEDDDYL